MKHPMSRGAEGSEMAIPRAISRRRYTVGPRIGEERRAGSVHYNLYSDPSRRWRYTVVDATMFRLVNVYGGLYLAAGGGGTDRNTTAVRCPCGDINSGCPLHKIYC
jgi:hypothetical protein